MRVLVPVVAALVLVAAAEATIVPQQGMAGVRLGMTKAQVRSAAGAPIAIKHGRNDFGSFTEFRYPFRVTVFFQGDRTVTNVRTTGRTERTLEDVGVGSTEARVKARVPGVRCKTFFRDFRECYVGSYRPGTRVTAFHMRRGRVVRVDVGFVID